MSEATYVMFFSGSEAARTEEDGGSHCGSFQVVVRAKDCNAALDAAKKLILECREQAMSGEETAHDWADSFEDKLYLDLALELGVVSRKPQIVNYCSRTNGVAPNGAVWEGKITNYTPLVRSKGGVEIYTDEPEEGDDSDECLPFLDFRDA